MKRIILSLVACMAAFHLQAQSISELFINIPDQYIPQLESEWRKDLVDLYQSGKEAQLQNLMGGTSRIKNMTSDYMLLESTERSQIEMKLLPLVNNTYIICLIATVEGPVADSRIEFYTTSWEPLTPEDLYTPVSGEWFLKENIDKSSDDYLYASSLLDMDLISYYLSPDDLSLTATYTTPLYVSPSERQKVEAILKDTPKIYQWNKSRFN